MEENSAIASLFSFYEEILGMIFFLGQTLTGWMKFEPTVVLNCGRNIKSKLLQNF